MKNGKKPLAPYHPRLMVALLEEWVIGELLPKENPFRDRRNNREDRDGRAK